PLELGGDEYLVRRQCRLQVAEEELPERDPARATGPVGDDLASVRERDDRQLRGRVRVGERAAEGASVPHTRVADVAAGPRGGGPAGPGPRRGRARPGRARRAVRPPP